MKFSAFTLLQRCVYFIIYNATPKSFHNSVLQCSMQCAWRNNIFGAPLRLKFQCCFLMEYKDFSNIENQIFVFKWTCFCNCCH